MTVAKKRKRAWYAGLTLALRAIANEIGNDHIRAFYDERARGVAARSGPRCLCRAQLKHRAGRAHRRHPCTSSPGSQQTNGLTHPPV
jgi:hypothetical protein